MRTLLIAILGLAVAAPGWAASITYLSDGRSVSAGEVCDPWAGVPCEDDSATETPAPGALVFNATAAVATAHASQNSTLADTSMSGSGEVYAFPDAPGLLGSGAESLFLAEFQLDEASAFDLSATVGFGVDSSSWLELRTADGNPIYSQGFGEVDPIDESGVLPAGDYVLDIVVSANIQPPFFASADYDFAFSLIPEPGTALLMMTGLLGLTFRRRPTA